jgi:hypothetical protein
MNFGRISDEAGLFRHCIYPNAFRGKTFLPEKLWYLVKKDDGALYGSLAWDRYLPRIMDVHAYGCSLSGVMNAKKVKIGKTKPKDRLFYCGAYHIRGYSVRALANTPGLNQVISADVFHLIEEGEIAHVALKISTIADDANDEGTKTVIVDRLWNSCTGPLKHVCTYDRDVAPHPSAELPDAPHGLFTDNKGRCRRFFWVLRCQVLTWLWRNSDSIVVSPPDTRKFLTRMLDGTKRRFCRELWQHLGPDGN